MKSFSRAALAAGLLLALALPAGAQGPQGWQAQSKTAMSITGNVRFTPTRITFANNASLPLQFVRIVPGASWMPGAGPGMTANLYRITAPQNPKLLRGNRLCGARPPTYLSVARKDGDIYLTVYDSAAEPNGSGAAFCAGYDYAPG